MLDVINTFLSFLLEYPALFFAGLGYFNGYLFREMNAIKIIAIILVVPYCIELLVSINWVFAATLPFLFCAVIGYWGTDKSKHKMAVIVDLLRDMVGR